MNLSNCTKLSQEIQNIAIERENVAQRLNSLNTALKEGNPDSPEYLSLVGHQEKTQEYLKYLCDFLQDMSKCDEGECCQPPPTSCCGGTCKN